MTKSSRPPLIGWPLGIVFSLLFVLFFFIQIISPVSHEPPEPLADSLSLTQLAAGFPLEAPPPEVNGEFHGKHVTIPALATLTAVQKVLGFTTNSNEKRIEVDLTRQRTYAFEGDRKVYEFIISSGSWGRTPTGEFTIWTKVRSQLMKGGSKELGTYYYLPNVPYVMFFYNNEIEKMRGFSFHGTYWHSNFGHPMSHGCINMKNEDAKTLYEWATPVVTNPKAWSTLATAENPGTKVVIYGTAPAE
jgi:lipoprotein-anchoring transpeptidase ErfK/SrfK